MRDAGDCDLGAPVVCCSAGAERVLAGLEDIQRAVQVKARVAAEKKGAVRRQRCLLAGEVAVKLPPKILAVGLLRTDIERELLLRRILQFQDDPAAHALSRFRAVRGAESSLIERKRHAAVERRPVIRIRSLQPRFDRSRSLQRPGVILLREERLDDVKHLCEINRGQRTRRAPWHLSAQYRLCRTLDGPEVLAGSAQRGDRKSLCWLVIRHIGCKGKAAQRDGPAAAGIRSGIDGELDRPLAIRSRIHTGESDIPVDVAAGRDCRVAGGSKGEVRLERDAAACLGRKVLDGEINAGQFHLLLPPLEREPRLCIPDVEQADAGQSLEEGKVGWRPLLLADPEGEFRVLEHEAVNLTLQDHVERVFGRDVRGDQRHAVIAEALDAEAGNRAREVRRKRDRLGAEFVAERVGETIQE